MYNAIYVLLEECQRDVVTRLVLRTKVLMKLPQYTWYYTTEELADDDIDTLIVNDQDHDQCHTNFRVGEETISQHESPMNKTIKYVTTTC